MEKYQRTMQANYIPNNHGQLWFSYITQAEEL